ncbi:hypothetical protein JCM24511_00840 [Saitozyma sp. JCM 24511]|nr:hypothetical protein JCM24511_00840 [Saitozyma sp. JCM 24511]
MPRRLGEYDHRSFRDADDEVRDADARHRAAPLDHRRHHSESRWDETVTRPERVSVLTDQLESASTSSRTRGDTSARLNFDTTPSLLRPLESSFAEFKARRARRIAAEAEASVGGNSASPQASRDTLCSQDNDDWVEVDLDLDRGPIRTTTHRTSYGVGASASDSATASIRGAIASSASRNGSSGSSGSSGSNGARTKSQSKIGTSSRVHSVSPPCTSSDLDALALVEEARREMDRLRNDPNAKVDELIASCVRYREAKKRAGIDESMSTSGYLLSSEGTHMQQSELRLPVLSIGQPIPSSRSYQPYQPYQPYQSSQINSPNPPSQPSHSQTSHTTLSSAPSASASRRRSSGGTGSREFRKSPLRQVMSADGGDHSEADEQSTGDPGLSAARH